MAELARIERSEITLQSIDELSLANRSEVSLPNGMGQDLARMLDEVQAAFPNQVLLPDTVKMYLSQWEDLALKFGLTDFRTALLKAIRSSEFVPSPKQIEEWCEAVKRDVRDRRDAKNYLDKLEEWKAQCAREKAEDEANGPREQSETEKRLNAILAARKERRRTA